MAGLLLEPGEWKRQWETFLSAPYIIFPIIAIFATAVWWLRGWVVKERLHVLKERLKFADERVLAADKAKDEVVRHFNDYKAKVETNGGKDALSAIAVRIEEALDKLSSANNAIRSAIGVAAAGVPSAEAVGIPTINKDSGK